LQAHVDRLSAAVNYLQDFPIDVEEVFPKVGSSDKTEKLKRRMRVSWHRYIINPKKTISLRKFFRRNNINIVLAEYGLTGIAVLSGCKDLKIPLIVHFHGSDAYSTKHIGRHRQAYIRMFGYASAIIAVSKDMARQLVSLGAPIEKIVYNPYGVEIDRFVQAPVITSPLHVLSVGRFVEKKAPYLTILAFKKVLERLPEAKLTMVGTGLLHDVCSKLIRALHIEHAVELKGAVNHDEVARLMHEARVFVQHSLIPASGDREGTPVAILEAGAAGLPVVSTRHAGISDAVIHGKTGFLVNESDIETMADYIYQLLASPDLANEMGKNARQHISANFNMERSINTLRNIIEQSVIRGPIAIHELTDNQLASLAPEKESRTYRW